ncbi:hypothetical protein, partial [Humibacillus sp. DSM 29435]|uniref:hypothetical protein n=1 Tax=Humibacillus sp. DSM 29435 TaxID=1869167 RepID=UPI001C304605
MFKHPPTNPTPKGETSQQTKLEPQKRARNPAEAKQLTKNRSIIRINQRITKNWHRLSDTLLSSQKSD